jgi:hypothetical protein
MKGLTENDRRILRLHVVSQVGLVVRYVTGDGCKGRDLKSQYFVVRLI